MSRYGFKISTYSENEDNDYEVQNEKLSPLLSEFARTIVSKETKPNTQTAVEIARSRNNAQSLMQQLTSVMTGKPRYATVDDAVKDMQDRTGLSVHLNNIKSANNDKKKVDKTANDTQIPESLSQYYFCDDIINYIKNNIKNTNGNTSIPALQHDILSLFSNKGLTPKDIINDEVAKYISECIYNEQKMMPDDHGVNNMLGTGVGKDIIDESTDPWSGLMPSK